MCLLTVHAPKNFEPGLQPLPEGISLAAETGVFDQVHWFVANQAAMEKDVRRVIGLLKTDVICWIYFPKGTSAITTDLSRDKGWDTLEKHEELQWLSLISFDENWSAFGVRLKAAASEPNKPLTEKPEPQREILNYLDAATKTIRLPDDFSAAIEQNEKARECFEKLSFSNRKEYVEWIITAKRTETRNRRVQATIDRLEKGWKNPANS